MFQKHTVYLFEVNNLSLQVSEIYLDKDRESVTIEETGKNGQEDCHMVGTIFRECGGDWEWDYGNESFDFYANPGTADAILEYMNRNSFLK